MKSYKFKLYIQVYFIKVKILYTIAYTKFVSCFKNGKVRKQKYKQENE